LFYRGDFFGALAQYERALSHYDDRERTALWASRVGEDAGITHRCYLALTLWQLGYPEQALRVSQETLKLAHAIEHPFSLAYAQHHTSWLYQQLGLPAETKVASEEGMQTAAEQGFAMFHATGSLYRAAGILLEGRPDEALPLLKRGLEAYRATGAGLALPYYLSILGDACIQASLFDDASDALTAGLAIAERTDELCHKAELYRLQGELAVRTGSQNGDAEAHFRRAIDMAQSQLSRAWELRATTSLARLCRQQGRRAEARQMLSDTYARFTEGFDTADLKAAERLLAELDTSAV
jgi:tetratricopeptide (TPR) repeat protein